MARSLRKVTAGSPTLFIVDDDVEIARDVDADGVHLGQDDMSIAEARRRWPDPGRIFRALDPQRGSRTPRPRGRTGLYRGGPRVSDAYQGTS